MSRSFQGPGGTLDLNNGLSDRLLRAMGYLDGPSTDGSMPIGEAVEALRVAVVAEADQWALDGLRALAGEVLVAGGERLEWW